MEKYFGASAEGAKWGSVSVVKKARNSLYGAYVIICGNSIQNIERKTKVIQNLFSVLLFTDFNIFLTYLVLQLVGTFCSLKH